jgi:2-polyprenyl-6-methoxyphenol hydroxylase-like FAD-dependent oxidoreductase
VTAAEADGAAAPAEVDVLVAGAGPAGCAAAALLGRMGWRVLLVDRAGVPRPRLCTHALMPSALPVLQELGVLRPMLEAGAQRWWGVRLWMEGTYLAAQLPRRGAAAPCGLSLRRELLDSLFFEAARTAPGVSVRLGWDVLRPLIRDGRVSGLRLRSPDGGECDVRSRLVVAADGRRSRLLRMAGGASLTLPNRHSAWIAYVDGIPREDRPALEAHYQGRRSVSLLPCDAGLRVAGVVTPGNDWPRREAAKRMLAALASMPELGERVRNATIVSPPVQVRGLRNTVRLRLPPGIVAAGDAALQSDPAFGQGISWALRGARRVARAADSALRAAPDGPVIVDPAAAREPWSLPLFLGMSAVSAIPPGSLLERLMVRSAARSPRTSTVVLRLATGFATAATDGGPRRSPGTFLGDVLAPV